MFLEIILIYVSLILVAFPTNRILITIVSQPHLNPNGRGGGGVEVLPMMALHATFTFPKMYLICTPKFCIGIVFNFSAKFWEQIKCILGNMELAFKGRHRPKGVPLLQVYERVGISLVEVYKRVGKSVIWACERAQKG